jgi:hypothetical protein
MAVQKATGPTDPAGSQFIGRVNRRFTARKAGRVFALTWCWQALAQRNTQLMRWIVMGDNRIENIASEVFHYSRLLMALGYIEI